MKLTEDQNNNINNYIDHLTKVSIRIFSYNIHEQIIGHCSGFLYQSKPNTTPIVITAGHKLRELGSFIETRIKKEGKTLLINAGKFKIFYNNKDIDYAYSILPTELYNNEIESYQGIEVVIYKHEFIIAKPNEAYGFAVINNHEFIKDENGLILPLYCCYEIFLELIDQDEHINYFKVAREFQGHDYYKGASGAPITDPEGAITSILINGDSEDGILMAFRLDNIVFDIKHPNRKL